MTLYNIHIYREMRLFFPAIEAGSAEEAAKIASAKPTSDAQYTEDCDGETLAALVDVVGDDSFEQSQTVDFEPERLRKVGPALLATLTSVKVALEHHQHWADTMPAHLLGVINDALTAIVEQWRPE